MRCSWFTKPAESTPTPPERRSGSPSPIGRSRSAADADGSAGKGSVGSAGSAGSGRRARPATVPTMTASIVRPLKTSRKMSIERATPTGASSTADMRPARRAWRIRSKAAGTAKAVPTTPSSASAYSATLCTGRRSGVIRSMRGSASTPATQFPGPTPNTGYDRMSASAWRARATRPLPTFDAEVLADCATRSSQPWRAIAMPTAVATVIATCSVRSRRRFVAMLTARAPTTPSSAVRDVDWPITKPLAASPTSTIRRVRTAPAPLSRNDPTTSSNPATQAAKIANSLG